MLLRATVVGSDFPADVTTAEVEVMSDQTAEWRDEENPYYVHGNRRKIVGKVVKMSPAFVSCYTFLGDAGSAMKSPPAEYDGEIYVVFQSLEIDGQWYHLRSTAVLTDGKSIKIVAHSHATP